MMSLANAPDSAKRDFQYYSRVMKPELTSLNKELYVNVLNKKCLLKNDVYGVSERRNHTNQTQVMRDPDAHLSIFDDEAFKFYIINYAEILGIDSLFIVSSHDRTLSYD